MTKRNNANDNARKTRHGSPTAHERQENAAADRFDSDLDFDIDLSEAGDAGEWAGERSGAARDEARRKSRDR